MQGMLILWLTCGTLRLRSPNAGYAKIEVTLCRVCSYCGYDVRGVLRLRLSYTCSARIEVTIAGYAKIEVTMAGYAKTEVTLAGYAKTEVTMCRAR